MLPQGTFYTYNIMGPPVGSDTLDADERARCILFRIFLYALAQLIGVDFPACNAC